MLIEECLDKHRSVREDKKEKQRQNPSGDLKAPMFLREQNTIPVSWDSELNITVLTEASNNLATSQSNHSSENVCVLRGSNLDR
jgi:hypothetical protein